MTRVDIVVAVRNEEQSIPVFLAGLDELQLPSDVFLKTIFVEDSSTDDTRALLRRLAAARPDVGYVMLAKGYGQGLALAIGLDRSTADAMIMMDVDGSHPVGVIPDMLRAYLSGARVVQCVRRSLVNRQTYRQVGTALFQLFARTLTGVDTRQQNIYYRLVVRDVAKTLIQPRYWHYLRFPLPTAPGALHTILIDTEERRLGASKYHLRRLVQLAIDAVTSLMTGRRLATVLTLAAVVAGALGQFGYWPLAALVAVGGVSLWRRWNTLHQSDTLDRIAILECAQVS